MKWLTRLLTPPGPPPAPDLTGPVYALLREHQTPGGPEETVADWLACEEGQARRVASALNAQEGRRRYRVVPLRPLTGEDLRETALVLTRLSVKGTQAGVRYAVTQRVVRVPEAFAPPLGVRTPQPTEFAPHLRVWTPDAEGGLERVRRLMPVSDADVHEALRPYLCGWDVPGALSGRMGAWPRARRLPGGMVLWAHADGTPHLWPGEGESVPACAFRVGGRFLRGPDDRCRVDVAGLMRMGELQ